ncbi:MAG: hypothetical protein KIH09_16180, partial [Candidatus Freyarchaeota archaeon]|nr:hypothetical protein [Candidatus Jordarchaeia archaeon]
LWGLFNSLALVYFVFKSIIDEFKSWWNDDHLADRAVMLSYADLQRIPDRERQALDFIGRDFHYTLYWHVEKDRFPYVRIVLDSFYAHDTEFDWGSSEPYLLIVGISLFPETAVWVPSPIPPVGDDVDSGEWDEDFPTIVVFDGRFEPYSKVGFFASLWEDDPGRNANVYDLAQRLRERLSGTARAGECGENWFERFLGVLVGEDCSGGGVYRFPVFNLGEPNNLWIYDLSPYGFEGENVGGCGVVESFCGGKGCTSGCATSILRMMQMLPDKLADRLT